MRLQNCLLSGAIVPFRVKKVKIITKLNRSTGLTGAGLLSKEIALLKGFLRLGYVTHFVGPEPNTLQRFQGKYFFLLIWAATDLKL